MKTYPKVNENIYDLEKWNTQRNDVTSIDGSVDELISKIRLFYRETHSSIFNTIIKQIWLEQQLRFNGYRRSRRVGNGFFPDVVFSRFMKIEVGISHRVLTANFIFTPIATYLIELFPDFMFNNPFEEPEKYLYPFKNITLDHMVFVYQMDNRMEILQEADRCAMSYAVFINWAANWALCYNQEKGEDIYELIGGHLNWPYLRNNTREKFWENEKFNFETI